MKLQILKLTGEEILQVDLDKTVEEIKKRNVCLTPGCVRAGGYHIFVYNDVMQINHHEITAAHVMEFIDPKVDPCDSFYDFACGKWREAHFIEDHRGGVSSFSVAADRNKLRLKGEL